MSEADNLPPLPPGFPPLGPEHEQAVADFEEWREGQEARRARRRSTIEQRLLQKRQAMEKWMGTVGEERLTCAVTDLAATRGPLYLYAQAHEQLTREEPDIRLHTLGGGSLQEGASDAFHLYEQPSGLAALASQLELLRLYRATRVLGGMFSKPLTRRITAGIAEKSERLEAATAYNVDMLAAMATHLACEAGVPNENLNANLAFEKFSEGVDGLINPPSAVADQSL